MIRSLPKCMQRMNRGDHSAQIKTTLSHKRYARPPRRLLSAPPSEAAEALVDSVVFPHRRQRPSRPKASLFSLMAEMRTWPDCRTVRIAYAATVPRFMLPLHHDLRRARASVLNVRDASSRRLRPVAWFGLPCFPIDSTPLPFRPAMAPFDSCELSVSFYFTAIGVPAASLFPRRFGLFASRIGRSRCFSTERKAFSVHGFFTECLISFALSERWPFVRQEAMPIHGTSGIGVYRSIAFASWLGY